MFDCVPLRTVNAVTKLLHLEQLKNEQNYHISDSAEQMFMLLHVDFVFFSLAGHPGICHRSYIRTSDSSCYSGMR